MAKKEEIQHDCEHCKSRYKSIFCQIAPEELQIINENKWCQTLEKGQQLFAEGAYPHGLFCVNSGKINTSRASTQLSSGSFLSTVINESIAHANNQSTPLPLTRVCS